jgi:hypothetical protein
MDPLDDFLKRQRRVTPPESRARDIERQVMARLPRENARRVRFRAAFAVAGSITLAICGVLLLEHRPAQRAAQTDFTESVVLVGDHACVWLEPVREKPSHE